MGIQKTYYFNNICFSSSASLIRSNVSSSGAVIGELLDLDGKMTHFGEWLKIKTGNAKDHKFVDGFVTASLTVCIGAMAVVGAIEDGVHGNHSILFAKAILDFVIILVMSATLGKGCLFAFVPVGLFQGTIPLFEYP